MPQDSYQQGIVRGAIVRINAAIPVNPADPIGDYTILLSQLEKGVVLSVLDAFVNVPAEPSGPVPIASAMSVQPASARRQHATRKKARRVQRPAHKKRKK